MKAFVRVVSEDKIAMRAKRIHKYWRTRELAHLDWVQGHNGFCVTAMVQRERERALRYAAF